MVAIRDNCCNQQRAGKLEPFFHSIPTDIWPLSGGTLPNLPFGPCDRTAACELGKLYAELRRAGRIMQIPDLQSAATPKNSVRFCCGVSSNPEFAAEYKLRLNI